MQMDTQCQITISPSKQCSDHADGHTMSDNHNPSKQCQMDTQCQITITLASNVVIMKLCFDKILCNIQSLVELSVS